MAEHIPVFRPRTHRSVRKSRNDRPRATGTVLYGTGKKTPGGAGTHTGRTQDTRAHKGTRVTPTNLTTIQPSKSTNTQPYLSKPGLRSLPRSNGYNTSKRAYTGVRTWTIHAPGPATDDRGAGTLHQNTPCTDTRHKHAIKQDTWSSTVVSIIHITGTGTVPRTYKYIYTHDHCVRFIASFARPVHAA